MRKLIRVFIVLLLLSILAFSNNNKVKVVREYTKILSVKLYNKCDIIYDGYEVKIVNLFKLS